MTVWGWAECQLEYRGMFSGIQTAALLRYFWKHDKFPHNLGFLVFWIKHWFFIRNVRMTYVDEVTLPLETNQVYLPFIPKGSSSVIVPGHECIGIRYTRVPGRANSSDEPVTAAAKTSQRSKYSPQTLYFPSSHTHMCAHTDRKHELRSGSLILQGGIWSKICFWRFSSKCSFCLC